VPEALAQDGGRGEGLLHRDLLVEEHADQQRQRILVEQGVRVRGVGEMHEAISPQA
jgi:hypothetical protein